ncbi:MAG: protease [Candidatus Firestonebacteria bacterium RIFOXYC2_FULL_39_67]|nr:MAG: protease [Candidatus Firestonebacteria bacterium RIFOXYD2_FULL_39_29]OGF52845.1 MAG: protease [Candidatus Firestonebacteria bacterium RifOxyC12_full_39_7]OGF57407.1 MAG: protease [Candidatus Firestonebacteria bacterium RIFOXYC2_FULL_39_67]
MSNLAGKRIVILVAEQFQDMEVMYPYYRFKEEGAEIIVAGTGSADIYNGKYGYPIKITTTADKIKASDVDAVIIPGGWAPDFLRRYDFVNKFVRDAFEKGKIIAAICHGGSVLVSARILEGKTATAFKAIKDDMIYAGCNFVDKEVVVDCNLVTSRTPDDLPAFCKTIIKELTK